jgi:hypothetical protein
MGTLELHAATRITGGFLILLDDTEIYRNSKNVQDAVLASKHWASLSHRLNNDLPYVGLST